MPFDQTIQQSKRTLQTIYAAVTKITLTEYAGFYCENARIRLESISGVNPDTLLYMFNSIYEQITNKKKEFLFYQYGKDYVVHIDETGSMNEFISPILRNPNKKLAQTLNITKRLFLIMLELKYLNQVLTDIGLYLAKYDRIAIKCLQLPESNFQEINYKVSKITESKKLIETAHAEFNHTEYDHNISLYIQKLDTIFDQDIFGIIATTNSLIQLNNNFSDLAHLIHEYKEDLNDSLRKKLPSFEYPFKHSIVILSRNLQEKLNELEAKKTRLLQNNIFYKERSTENSIKRNELLLNFLNEYQKHVYPKTRISNLQKQLYKLLNHLIKNTPPSKITYEKIHESALESFNISLQLNKKKFKKEDKKQILIKLSQSITKLRAFICDKTTITLLDKLLFSIMEIINVLTGTVFNLFNENRKKIIISKFFTELNENMEHAITSL